MGTLSDLAQKAKNLASSHPDQADKAVDRAEDFVDERTDGRYDEQTDHAADAVRGSYAQGQDGDGTTQEP